MSANDPTTLCECGHARSDHSANRGYCFGCYRRSADSKYEDQNVGCRKFKSDSRRREER